MDFRLMVFLQVARIGQLTKASRHLNLSPSSVSAHIASLENDVGATLFERGSRGMKLTASGKILLQAAEQMEALWNKTRHETQAAQAGTAHLRIAASHTATDLYLPQPLGRFRSLWPEIHIHFTMTNSMHVVELLGQGLVDIGITEGMPVHGRVRTVKLWEDPLALVVSSHHPLSRQTSILLSELQELDWILREPGSGTRSILERALERAGSSIHQLTVMMELSSLRAILAMVANNIGVSVVSRGIQTSAEITVSNITLLNIKDLNLNRSLQAILPLQSACDPAEKFLSLLKQSTERMRDRT